SRVVMGLFLTAQNASVDGPNLSAVSTPDFAQTEAALLLTVRLTGWAIPETLLCLDRTRTQPGNGGGWFRRSCCLRHRFCHCGDLLSRQAAPISLGDVPAHPHVNLS